MICNEIQPIPEDWQKRPIIRQYNANNELVVRTYGKTQEELLQDHLDGKCGMFCEYCYQEAMKSLKEENIMDCHECPHYQTEQCITCVNPVDYLPAPEEVDDDGAEWYYRMPLEDSGAGTMFPNPNDEDIPF